MSGPRISASLQRIVRKRARDCCEYCRLSQQWQEAEFHIDHIQPRSLGGPTSAANLALACVSCSLRKGARSQGRDPISGERVRWFNPREDSWTKHFAWTEHWRMQGLTPIGRATIAALQMNGPRVVRIRQLLAAADLFPARRDRG
jgi:hypothetical protein